MKSRVLLPLVFMLLSGPLVSAANMGTASVEWLTCESDFVVLAKVKKVTSIKGPGDVIYDDCALDVEEWIKGNPEPGEEFGFIFRHTSIGRFEDQWKAPNQTLLVFLSKIHNEHDYRQEEKMRGRLVPTQLILPFTAIVLSAVPESKYLFDRDMNPVTEPAALLTLCRQWAKSPIHISVSEEAPWDSAVHQALYALSAVSLEVPAEERHRQRFLKFAYSTDLEERSRAASELGKFPGPESVAALRHLLEDDFKGVWGDPAGEIVKFEYSVRSSAYHGLKYLGQTLPSIELERKPTDGERSEYRREALQRIFKECLRDGWSVKEIRDGETRTIESHMLTVVEIDLQNDAQECKLILVPKEFGQAKKPGFLYLGINRLRNSGGRQFYASQNTTEGLLQQLNRHFGFENGER